MTPSIRLEGIAANPERRLSEFALSGNAPPAIPSFSSESESAEVYAMPASSVQRRFWLLEQLDPGNPAFHMLAQLNNHFEGHGPGKLLLPLVRRQARKQLAENHHRLKERLESGAV